MNTVADLLQAADFPGRVALTARVALTLRDDGPARCPTYLDALVAACLAMPPVFDTKDYADTFYAASRDGQWMAVSLMTNAQREGDGATRLWSLCACCDDPHRRALLKKHAIDESRHALAYLALIDFVFPGAITSQFRAELETLSPRYSVGQQEHAVEGSDYAHAPTTDDFVQMNIAEIRTTIHHLMQRRALRAHCPQERWPHAQKVLDSLLRDELDHVGYTAVVINEDGSKGVDVAALYEKRLGDFNTITVGELQQLVFE